MKRMALVFLMLALLLGCQPTPEREAIVNRADSSMEQTVSAPKADAVRYEAPGRWEETIEMKNLTIHIDADVVLPDGDQYPIQTIKRHSFSGEDVLNVLSACFAGPFELRTNTYSMSEIDEDIRFELRGEWIDWDEQTGEVTWAPYEEETEALRELKEKMALCPAEDTFVPLTASLMTPSREPYVIRTGDGTLLYVTLREDALVVKTTRRGEVQDENTVWEGGYIGEPWHQTLDHIKISEEDAKSIGEAALDRAGLKNQFGVGLYVKARNAQPTVDEPYVDVRSEGYLLYVARNGGIYIPYPQGGGYFHEDGRSALAEVPTDVEYSQRWKTDWMELYVSENGVESFGWYDANELVTIANENVTLLPFEQIRTHIRDDLTYSYAWTDDKEVGVSDITVKKIVLSCSITPIKNNPDEAFLVPTWVVVYNNARGERAHSRDTLMLINAVDGSYMHVN